jgi:hypothetical protein
MAYIARPAIGKSGSVGDEMEHLFPPTRPIDGFVIWRSGGFQTAWL